MSRMESIKHSENHTYSREIIFLHKDILAYFVLPLSFFASFKRVFLLYWHCIKNCFYAKKTCNGSGWYFDAERVLSYLAGFDSGDLSRTGQYLEIYR